ncbi:MAG: Fic family protein [Chthoniobacteraceae bacterium]|jgi:Fic family protein
MPNRKIWNWQQEDWQKFRYDVSKLEAFEAEFLRQSGVFSGAVKHVGDEDRQQLTVELISDEALKTSEIEGEILNRDSLQSSIRRNFGLTSDNRKVPPAEQGIARIMVDLYRHFDAPLTDEILFRWHELLMSGRQDVKDIGRYRRDESPMQVVSGPLHAPKVHFEAPPSHSLPKEMKRFIGWFNHTAPKGKTPMRVLARAGIAHLYFVCIHPFEDGNGRISRAVAEKAVSQGLGQSTLIALSHTINSKRKAYYDMLERSNKRNEVTEWLVYFAKTVLEAQEYAQRMLDFLIAKTKFFDRFRGQFNERQEKVVARMFREGPNGFTGGLSAENYIRITGTSRATATRDLQDLVDKQALTRTGSLKSTRYHLPIELRDGAKGTGE